MAFFRILREVKNAETARTRKHPYASYDFVARSSAKNRILNVNLRGFRLKKNYVQGGCVFWRVRGCQKRDLHSAGRAGTQAF